MAVSLSTPAGNVEVVVGLVGEHMVNAICCATAIGLAAEIPLDVIAAGLEATDSFQGAWSSWTRVKIFRCWWIARTLPKRSEV